MNFTREDILKIYNALLQLGRKDSEFKEANTPLNSEDYITILQNGINKKVSINNLLSTLGLLKKDDFINVSDRYDEYYIQLSEAVTIIANNKRKKGLVITFQDINGSWRIYQFNDEISNFIKTKYWKDLSDFKYPIVNSILPDEEDLTLTYPDKEGNSFIQLKNREYNSEQFSGMGKIILRKNIVEIEDPVYGKIKKNVLDQTAFTQDNTMYEIRYDFDFNEKTITIPENCVLNFQGGSFKNGIIIFNNTKLDGNNQYFNDCSFRGTLATQHLYISKFGIKKDVNFDASYLIQEILDCIDNKNCTIDFDLDYDYNIGSATHDVTILIPNNVTIDWSGSGFFVLKKYSRLGAAVVIESQNVTINNIKIDGGGDSIIVGGSGQNGIGIGHSSNVFIDRGIIKNCHRGISGDDYLGDGGKAIQIEPTDVSNCIIQNLYISNCHRALSVLKSTPNGIIQVIFNNITAKDCEQFMSTETTNLSNNDAVQVSLSNFIAENCGSLDGVFTFSNSVNVNITNGKIIGDRLTESIFRGRRSKCNITNIDIFQPCDSVINLIPHTYGVSEVQSQNNNIKCNLYNTYTYIFKTDTHSYNAEDLGFIEIFSNIIPTDSVVVGSYFNSSLIIKLNFASQKYYFGTGVGLIANNYHYAKNLPTNNILFYDERHLGTTEESPSKESMYKGFLYYNTTLRRLTIFNGSGWVSDESALGGGAMASYGTSESRPEAAETSAGHTIYETDTKRKILWNGEHWVGLNGLSLNTTVMQSSQRPIYDIEVGYCTFDVQLGKPIWVKQIQDNIVTWVDATGTIV